MMSILPAGQRKFTALASMVALIMASMLPAKPVYAATCDGCVVAAIAAVHSTFTAFWKNLYTQVKSVRQSIAVVTKDQLKVEHDIQYQVPTDGCRSVTVGAKVMEAVQGTAQASRALSQGDLLFQLIQPDEQEPESKAQSAQRLLHTHNNEFCSERDQQKGRCTASPTLPNADLMADSLLHGAGKTGGVTYTYSQEQIQAAEAYIHNVTEPYVTPELSATEETSAAGKAYLTLKYVEEAKLSAAKKALRDILAARIPTARLENFAKVIFSETHLQGSGGNPYLDFRPVGNGRGEISLMELLNADVSRRYANPAWHFKIATSSPAAVERERAYMQALQLYLDFYRLQQMERVETLLAVMLANQTKESLEEQLRVQRRAAGQTGM